MARRKRTVRTRCAEPECSEYAHFEADNARDEERIRREQVQKWKCLRHSRPDEWMSTTNTERVTRLVAGKSTKYPNLTQLFWSEGSGFTHGPGFRADADEFPEGTILEVTARIILPELAKPREGG